MNKATTKRIAAAVVTAAAVDCAVPKIQPIIEKPALRLDRPRSLLLGVSVATFASTSAETRVCLSTTFATCSSVFLRNDRSGNIGLVFSLGAVLLLCRAMRLAFHRLL